MPELLDAGSGSDRLTGRQAVAAVEIGAVRWVTAVEAPEVDFIRTESRHGPAPTVSREPVMVAVTRRREFGEVVLEPVGAGG